MPTIMFPKLGKLSRVGDEENAEYHSLKDHPVRDRAIACGMTASMLAAATVVYLLCLLGLVSVAAVYVMKTYYETPRMMHCPKGHSSAWIDLTVDPCIMDLAKGSVTEEAVAKCEEPGHGTHYLGCHTNERLARLMDSGHCMYTHEFEDCDALGRCTTHRIKDHFYDGAGNLICWEPFGWLDPVVNLFEDWWTDIFNPDAENNNFEYTDTTVLPINVGAALARGTLNQLTDTGVAVCNIVEQITEFDDGQNQALLRILRGVKTALLGIDESSMGIQDLQREWSGMTKKLICPDDALKDLKSVAQDIENFEVSPIFQAWDDFNRDTWTKIETDWNNYWDCIFEQEDGLDGVVAFFDPNFCKPPS